jgi:CubicO group peptidase (beta-lactamase class C family)
MVLQGNIDQKYSLIATAFINNFKDNDEIGASLCVYHNDKLVIDIWAGYKDLKKQELWEENTVVPFFSTTKVVAASCLAICHSRGLFDYKDKVSKYWKNFAKNGKGDIAITQLLQHRGGLAAIDKKLTIELIKDRELLEEIIAEQKPYWNPGDYQGYHCWTIGWYISALLSKIDTKKRRLKEFVEDEILPNIDGELRVGIDDSFDFSRIAVLKPISKTKGLFTMPFKFVKEFFNPWSLTFKSMLNPSFVSNHANFNRKDILELEFGSGGGIGNAKGIASLLNGITNQKHPLFLGKKTLDYLTQYPSKPSIGGFEDLVLKQNAFIFHAGYMKPSNHHNFSLNQSAFGRFGAGGSFVISDPENKLTFAYTMNNMSHDMMNMKREIQIREAVYKTIANNA